MNHKEALKKLICARHEELLKTVDDSSKKDAERMYHLFKALKQRD